MMHVCFIYLFVCALPCKLTSTFVFVARATLLLPEGMLGLDLYHVYGFILPSLVFPVFMHRVGLFSSMTLSWMCRRDAFMGLVLNPLLTHSLTHSTIYHLSNI